MNRLTASNFYNICTCKDKTKTAKRLKFKKQGQTDSTEAMRYGLNMEEFIFQEVKKWFKVPVRKCGFILHPNYNFIGASPDGLIGDHAVLEIKCLYSLRGQDSRPDWLVVEGGTFRLKKTHSYYYQVQGEMMCSDRNHCVLLVYHQMAAQCNIYTVFVTLDPKFIADMLHDLLIFWDRYYSAASP
jgi:hypothetical protein